MQCAQECDPSSGGNSILDGKMQRDPAPSLVDLSALRIIPLPSFSQQGSELVVAECEEHLPIPIRRVFTVRAEKNTARGKHAHRRCSQILICLNGIVEVNCKDGSDERSIRLDRRDRALLIPPSIWAEQIYLVSPTILLVLCDKPFEEDDYIRDWQEFETFRTPAGAGNTARTL